MSIQDEGQLRVRLGRLLDDVDPHPAPVGAVIRRGRGIRQRRRALVAGGVAVVAAVAVLGPTVLRSELSAPPAPLAPRYNVTVSPPAQGAGPGVIATGSINGWHWQATLSGTGNDLGVTFGKDFPLMPLGKLGPAGDPASLDSEGDGQARDPANAYVGPVLATVDYVTVTLANGQLLTLRPQPWEGHRYIAVVLPQKLRVINAAAYGASGILSYAIPFRYEGNTIFQTWLRPGQPGTAPATAQIGAGGSGRYRWTATAYAGPWGLCVEVAGAQGGGFCQDVNGRSSFGLVTGQFGSGPGAVEIGLARPDVAYLLVARSDGSVVRVPVAHVPGYADGLTAVIRPGHPNFTSWVAYDASGKRLGSGKGDPVGFPGG
jgi:hypothetical protein